MHKIAKFPITIFQKKQNIVGQGYVPCEYSEKYLDIKNNSHSEFTTIKVMSDQGISGEADAEICELVVSKNILLKALNQKKK